MLPHQPKTVAVKIAGGLGNQLFQFAAAYALSKKAKSKLVLDLQHYAQYALPGVVFSSQNTPRKFLLSHLISSLNFAPANGFKNSGLQEFLNSSIFSYRFFSKFFQSNFFYSTQETFFCWWHLILLKNSSNQKNRYLTGYYQGEQHFKVFAPELKNLITPQFKVSSSFEKFRREILKTNSVAVHVRRGDYLVKELSTIHPVQTKKYFFDAIECLEKLILNPKYFIFSDDIPWCKQTFLHLKDCVFVSVESEHKDLEEFQLIRTCHHQIISNSSYSWWAAWLNTYSAKIVIAPKNWYVQNNKRTKHLIPPGWRIL